MNLHQLQAMQIGRISPSSYEYNELIDGFELDLGECSTVEGLSLLDIEQKIVVFRLDAQHYKNLAWITKADMPH